VRFLAAHSSQFRPCPLLLRTYLKKLDHCSSLLFGKPTNAFFRNRFWKKKRTSLFVMSFIHGKCYYFFFGTFGEIYLSYHHLFYPRKLTTIFPIQCLQKNVLTLSPAAYIIRGNYYCLLYDLLEKYLDPLFIASFSSGTVVVFHIIRHFPIVSQPPSDFIPC
jgi:hypothetical protein